MWNRGTWELPLVYLAPYAKILFRWIYLIYSIMVAVRGAQQKSPPLIGVVKYSYPLSCNIAPAFLQYLSY